MDLSKLSNKVASDSGITARSIIHVLFSVTNCDCFTIFCGLSSIRAFSKLYGSIAIFYTFVGKEVPFG
jgi:hypothetical protein